MGKRDRCAVFGCNNDRLFPEKFLVTSLFARKAPVNTERVPPGHLIIPRKSNKFNMAAVSVKRSIVKAAFELKSSRGCEKRSKASPDRRIVKRLLIKRFDDLLPPLRQKKKKLVIE